MGQQLLSRLSLSQLWRRRCQASRFRAHAGFALVQLIAAGDGTKPAAGPEARFQANPSPA
jgi:hypothetical protein